jgi:uncharacterized membrane protein SpoIIM required for sporulation
MTAQAPASNIGLTNRAVQPSLALVRVLPALVFVLSAVAAGAVYGSSVSSRTCARDTVHFLPVVANNALLDILLMSGLVTVGVSTVFVGGFLLVTTGAGIGSIVASYGSQGALLLAPHGVVECLSWIAAAAVGLAPLTSRFGPGTQRGELLRRDATRCGIAALLLVVVAGAVETIWTGWYGPRLGC